jgi:hypothetical protein
MTCPPRQEGQKFHPRAAIPACEAGYPTATAPKATFSCIDAMNARAADFRFHPRARTRVVGIQYFPNARRS